MQTNTIAGARAALRKNDRKAALSSLIEAWRIAPAVPLALAIEELGGALAVAHDPIAGAKLEARQAAWLALATKRNDPTVVDRLLESIEERRWQATLERAIALVSFMPDPRIGRLLVRWLERAPFSEEAFFESLTRAVFPACRDPRVLSTLERMPQTGWIARATTELRGALPKAVALDAEAAAMLGELRAALGPPRSGPALLAAIRENPDDDGLRLVYADWLLEQGDPLGEFIALQYRKRERPLAAADAARERALVDAHGTRWLGRLAKAVKKDSVVFERGFPSRCELKGNVQYDLDADEWATIREVSIPSTQGLQLPVMRGLKRAVLASSLYTLCPPGQPAPPVEEVACGFSIDANKLETLALPMLRRLILDSQADPAQLPACFATPIGRQLRELSVQLRPESLRAWWIARGKAPPALETLRLFTHRTSEWGGSAGWVISLERNGILVERLADPKAPVTDAAMVAELGALPDAARALLRVGRFEGTPLAADAAAALRRLLPSGIALPGGTPPSPAARPRRKQGPAPTFKQLLEAVKSGDVVKVDRLLSDGAPLNEGSQSAIMPALGVAGARLGKEVALAIVRRVVDAGLDVNQRVADDRLPLTWTFNVFEAVELNEGVAALLLERGARPDEETLAMCVRVLGDDVSWLGRLVDAGVVEGGRGGPGAALRRAAELGRSKALALLIQHGDAPIDATDADDNPGWTALHYAALAGSKAVVDALIAAGADRTAVSTEESTAYVEGEPIDVASGATPALVARICGHTKLAATLTGR